MGLTEKVTSCLETMKWLPMEIQVLCLGLGSPMESRSSTAQLILLLSVCDQLNIVRICYCLVIVLRSNDYIPPISEPRKGYLIRPALLPGRYTRIP